MANSNRRKTLRISRQLKRQKEIGIIQEAKIVSYLDLKSSHDEAAANYVYFGTQTQKETYNVSKA